MSSYIDTWVSHQDFSIIKQKIRGRKVIIWGAYSGGAQIERSLEDYGIFVYAYLDLHKNDSTYRSKIVLNSLENLNKNDYFLIIPLDGYRKDIIDSLNNCSFVENNDYIYVYNNIPEIGINFLKGDYKDVYGNIIKYNGPNLNVNIRFLGWNNHLFIDENIKDNSLLQITLEDGSDVYIGRNFNSFESCKLEAISGDLYIGDSCSLLKDSKIRSEHSSIKIGDFTTTGERLFCASGSNSSLSIGADCMISNDVTFLSGDMHSIIDLKGHVIANSGIKSICINDHVWIGKSVTVLYNTDVGCGSIIGAASVVKGYYPPNSLSVGNIAHVIKDNRTWDRRDNISIEEWK